MWKCALFGEKGEGERAGGRELLSKLGIARHYSLVHPPWAAIRRDWEITGKAL